MERTVWTDERLDDRFDRIEKRFDRLEAEIAALRREMHNWFLAQTTAILGLAVVIAAHNL